MGDLAISAANATFTQIKAIFTGKTDAQLWAMIGVTPMIGVNDPQTRCSARPTPPSWPRSRSRRAWACCRTGRCSATCPAAATTTTSAWSTPRPTSSTSSWPPPRRRSRARWPTAPTRSRRPSAASAWTSPRRPPPTPRRCSSTSATAPARRSSRSPTWARAGTRVNTNSGKAIDIAAASTADGAKVQQYTDNGTHRPALLDQAGFGRHHLRHHQRRQRQVPGRGRLEHQRRRQDPAMELLRQREPGLALHQAASRPPATTPTASAASARRP